MTSDGRYTTLRFRATWFRRATSALKAAVLRRATSALRATSICGSALLPIFGLTGCAHQVVRISEGTARMERPINAPAYALYAQAVLQEKAGDTAAAVASYRAVLQHDSEADEVWVRLAALECRHDLVRAKLAFARAERLRPHSAARSLAEARCLASHGDVIEAQIRAEEALRCAPTDAEPSRLLVQLMTRRGLRDDALRFAWAHVAMFPRDTSGWLLLAQIVPLGAAREQLLHRIGRRMPPNVPRVILPREARHTEVTPEMATMSRARLDLEHGLVADDRRLAQRAARDLRLGTVPLMSKALELGALEHGRALADLAGRVQPENPSLWLTRLDLADRLQDASAFDGLLREPVTSSSPLNSDDRRRLLELVDRRVEPVASP